jgi:hypothetical protein
VADKNRTITPSQAQRLEPQAVPQQLNAQDILTETNAILCELWLDVCESREAI